MKQNILVWSWPNYKRRLRDCVANQGYLKNKRKKRKDDVNNKLLKKKKRGWIN